MRTIEVIDRSGMTWETRRVEIDFDPDAPIVDERGLIVPVVWRALREKFPGVKFHAHNGDTVTTPINAEEVNRAAGDLRNMIAREIGQPQTRGRGWQFRCPLHNEKHGASLSVYENGWTCRGKCDRGGDAISWVMETRGLSFEDACAAIMGNALPPAERPVFTPPPETSDPPDQAWQDQALAIVEFSERALWETEAGRQGLDYLRGRGLKDWTIKHARLGFLPYRRHGGEWIDVAGVRVPCGISIPWFSGATLWAINVRRFGVEPKYMQVPGGHIKGALYGTATIRDGKPIAFTEGEFDALIAYQFGGLHMGVVTLGGNTNRLNDRWLPLINRGSKLISLHDNDQAGENAAEHLRALRKTVSRRPVPVGKDMTDFALASPKRASRWLESTTY